MNNEDSKSVKPSRNMVTHTTFSKEECLILVNESMTSIALIEISNDKSSQDYEIHTIEECAKLIQESVNPLAPKAKEKNSLVRHLHYKEDEVYCLIQGNYDPRNHGKVPFNRKNENDFSKMRKSKLENEAAVN